MRPVMTVMGSLLLAGNLLLALPVRQNTVQLRNAEQAEQEMRKGMTESLIQKGLEPAAANHLVAEQYGRYGSKLAQAFVHLRAFFPELAHGAVLAYLAERTLHRETFAFDNYDHMVAMLHRLHGVDLSASHYARLRQCVLLNRSLFRSYTPEGSAA